MLFVYKFSNCTAGSTMTLRTVFYGIYPVLYNSWTAMCSDTESCRHSEVAKFGAIVLLQKLNLCSLAVSGNLHSNSMRCCTEVLGGWINCCLVKNWIQHVIP